MQFRAGRMQPDYVICWCLPRRTAASQFELRIGRGSVERSLEGERKKAPCNTMAAPDCRIIVVDIQVHGAFVSSPRSSIRILPGRKHSPPRTLVSSTRTC